MPDLFTLLENKLDELYIDKRDHISDAKYVPNWDDYNYRAGYLQAIRDFGRMLKDIRKPEGSEKYDGITGVLEVQDGT